MKQSNRGTRFGRRLRAVPACGLALALAACSGSSGSTARQASSAPAAAATTAAQSATAASSPVSASTQSATQTVPASSSSSAWKLRATQVLSDSGVDISFTVSNYSSRRAGANAELLPADAQIAMVAVKACLKSSADGSPVGFSWQDWSLLFSDDTTAEPLSAWSPRDFPSALYPNDATKAVPVGECRSGLVPFDVPAVQSGDPVKVIYSVNGQTLEWNR